MTKAKKMESIFKSRTRRLEINQMTTMVKSILGS